MLEHIRRYEPTFRARSSCLREEVLDGTVALIQMGYPKHYESSALAQISRLLKDQSNLGPASTSETKKALPRKGHGMNGSEGGMRSSSDDATGGPPRDHEPCMVRGVRQRASVSLLYV